MTDDLDTLRPEIREAVSDWDREHWATIDGKPTPWSIIRAELLRLADLEKQLRDAYARQHEALQGWVQRATDAKAELAALKVRIAESPVAYLTSKTGVGPCNVASMAHGVVFDSSSYGKSVRVVLDE